MAEENTEGTQSEVGDNSTAITEGAAEALRNAQGSEGENKGGEGENKGEGESGAPETYEDFKVPDDMKVDAEKLTKFQDLAREFKLTQDGAQKLIDMQVEFSKDVLAQNVEAWKTMRDGWLKDSKADEEIGGQKYAESIEVSQRALVQFGTPALIELLETYGLGNHPEMIRFTARVGAAIGEDKIVPGGGGPGGQQKSTAERIFGTT